jgi:pimeloyl-ACP methyl ester carboxylesterase
MREYRQPNRFRRVAGSIAAVIVVLLGVELYLSHLIIFEKYVLRFFGAPTYLPVKCWFENPGTRKIDCGYLYVLEDRDNPDGAYVRLPIAIVRGRGVMRLPVLFLDGGPGASPFITERLSGVLLNRRAETAPWSANRDLIFMDIRGVGLSKPSLRCPRVRASTYWEYGPERWTEKLHACADKLVQQGIQLARYNSQEVVRDIAELQDKLGIERWVLFGESYGTRPAMMFIRDHPERVKAAVLAGAFPPWVGRQDGVYRHMDRIFDSLEEACEADEHCARSYPDIKSTLISALEAAREAPYRLEVSSFVPTVIWKTARAKIDDAEILYWLSLQLSQNGGVQTAPKLIKALSEGHYQALEDLISNWPFYEDPFLTQGAHWSIWCNDAPELRESLLREQARTLTYMSDIILRAIDEDVCNVWPHVTDFALSSRPADYATEIPTLILAGEFDMPTPREWAEETEQVLSRSVIFNVPAAGHNYRDYSCAQRAVEAFLRNPGNTPNVICTENENRFVFD